jgi:phosphate butyryltransferase
MPLPGFDGLLEAARARRKPLSVAVAGGADPTILEAVRVGCDEGWLAPVLFDRERNIQGLADTCGIDLHGMRVVDTREAAAAAVAFVREQDERALLMKGQIATPELLKAILDPQEGLRTGRVICQVVLMEICAQQRSFLLADTGICIQPDLPQKKDILYSLVEVAGQLGVAEPRVAVMAASEKLSEAMPETLDAGELQRQNEIGVLRGCLVRGPLSFDLAYSVEAAARKRLEDRAFGVADGMLFPNLLSANLTVKAIMYTAPCRFGGVLMGTRCPVAFMSRADTTQTRLHSLALACAVVGRQTGNVGETG